MDRPGGPFRFCPYCASALTTRCIPAHEGVERRVCSVCRFIEWGNSKPSASAIVLNNHGQLLLVRRSAEPFAGWWDIPGGFLEAGEHPEQGVVRELAEETGLIVTVERMVGVYMDVYGPYADPTLNFYYVCRVSGDATPTPKDDVSEVGWFEARRLPGPIAFDNANAALRDWLHQEGERTIGG